MDKTSMNRLYVNIATSDEWKFNREVSEDEQPDMVRLAWLLDRDDGTELADACHLIRLEPGRRMDPTAVTYTGITNKDLETYGYSQFGAMTEFLEEAVSQASVIVAFSWEYHRRVLERELRRPDPDSHDRMFEVSAQGIKQVGRQHLPLWPVALDVMISLRPLLQIENPGRAGFKLPSFQEASDRITGNNPPLSLDPIENGRVRVARVRAFHQYMMQSKLQMTARI